MSGSQLLETVEDESRFHCVVGYWMELGLARLDACNFLFNNV
jgi:hypothetical protein